MCVIIHFEPNAMMDKTSLYNAVHNNWQGYGLVLKDGNGHIEVIRKYHENGNDFNEIWDLIEDNKSIERFLHVRYTTKGSSSLENTQPFEVYNSSKRRVVFMHNGTLSGFGPQHGNNYGKSDTLDFCEKILQPSLIRWNGPQGMGDYTDPEFLRLIVDKQWTTYSKGLFISNDLDPVYLGPSNGGWSEFKVEGQDENAPKIRVSNNDYFKNLTRGPEYDRLKKEEDARREAERKSTSTFQGNNSNNSLPNGVKAFKPEDLNKDPDVLRAINNISTRFDFDSDSNLAQLEQLTYEEWYDYLHNEDATFIAALLEHFFMKYGQLYRSLQKESMAKHKATLRLEKIAKINPEIMELSNAA